LAKFDLKGYARVGAEKRVSELNAELAEIYRAFPDLRSGRSVKTASGGGRRHRKPMTAAQKKAVSVRMRKYWAARRKEKE
jgi:hypothetical protein